jgi:hypothetical protein
MSPQSKHRKKLVVMRKQYVDKDGVLIQDKANLQNEKSKIKLIHELDLAHMVDGNYDPNEFRQDSPLSPPLGKKQSMDLADNSDVVYDKIKNYDRIRKKAQSSNDASYFGI